MVKLLLSGFIFSPLMGGEYRAAGVCEQDSLVAYEKVGAELAEIIPEGSNVYWDVKNAVPLLYLPHVNFHAAQIYSNFSYRLGGNTAEIYQKGFWNEVLAKLWADEADFLVYLANNNLTYELTVPESDSKFEVFNTSPINPCNPDTYLVIYQKSLFQ